MSRFTRPLLLRYAVALAATGAAAGIRLALMPVLGPTTSNSFFYPAVMLAALYGGFGPGAAATALAVLSMALFFRDEPVAYHFDLAGALRIGIFLTVSLLTSALCEMLLRARRRAEETAIEARRHEEQMRESQEQMRRSQEETRRSEERFRLAVEAVEGMIYEWDLESGAVDRSRGMLELLGYDPDEVPQTDEWWREHVHPDDLAEAIERRRAAFHDPTVTNAESQMRVRNSAGEYRYIWNRMCILRDAAGAPRRVVGCTADITDRKRVEQEREHLLELERHARERAERSAERTATLQTVTALLGQSMTVSEVMEVMVGHAVTAIGAATGSVYVLNERGDALEMKRSRGYPESVIANWKAIPIDSVVPHTDAITRGEPVWITSSDDYIARYPHLADLPGVRDGGARAALPLLANGRIYGTIGLTFRQERHFEEDDRAFVTAFVSQCAQAIDRALLYEAERHARAEAEHATEALRESQRHLRRLVESEIVGIFYAAFDGSIDEANDGFLRMIGYSRLDLEEGRVRWTDLTPPGYEAVDALAVEQLRRQGFCDPFEKEYLRKDGSRIYLHIGVVTLDTEAGTNICYAIDITERKRAEHALRVSEARFRTLVGSIDDMVFTLDRDGRHTEVYGRWLDRLAIVPEFFIGRTARQILGAEGAEVHEEANRHALAGEHVVYNWTLPINDELLHCETSLSPILNELGETVGIVGVARDVTEQRRWERELSQAKETAEAASRAKDQFLAVLSHELRTPLTPVLAAVQAMQDDDELPETSRLFVEIIQRNVELEARLIDDLLDLTRIERGKIELNLEIVDAHALLGSAIDICRDDADRRRLELRAELAAARHQVVADSARLQQVFWNLIKNAVKFTPEGGHVVVRTSNLGDGRLSVEVEDTGIGIDADVLPRIFDAFEQGNTRITRQFGGLGLGLAISRAITELHGGSLRAASLGKGEGATFTMELATASSGDDSDGAPARIDASAPARILLVDDHRDTSRVMQLYLRRQGYQVHSAYSLRSALVLASGVEFDLVISDVGLPDGSGVELMRELRRLKPVKGIALSGFGLEEDAMRSIEVGFAEHLVKPVSAEKLREAIERVLS